MFKVSPCPNCNKYGIIFNTCGNNVTMHYGKCSFCGFQELLGHFFNTSLCMLKEWNNRVFYYHLEKLYKRSINNSKSDISYEIMKNSFSTFKRNELKRRSKLFFKNKN